jgi:predicted RNA-binding Zn ribbon-like protein
VDAGDLTVLTQFWRMASQQLRLTVHADELSWEYEQNEADLRRILWPVVQSAVELLQSDQRHRVGQCQDDRGCGFLFLDTSRNRSRRWCSMESCGNRAKANRHYARVKK